jgi:hypothetical protein
MRKHYLSIDYQDIKSRQWAKSLGARWDADAKSWWVDGTRPHADLLIRNFGVKNLSEDAPEKKTDVPSPQNTNSDDGHLDQEDENSLHGFVYCAVCPSQQGLVKIGYTTRSPLQRMRELSNTSVAEDFYIAKMAEVADVAGAEMYIHDQLPKRGFKRINPRREFFCASVSDVDPLLREVEKKWPCANYISLGVVLTIEERNYLQDKLMELHSIQNEIDEEASADTQDNKNE